MSDPRRLLDGELEHSERALLEAMRADAPSEQLRVGMWKTLATQAAVAGATSTSVSAASGGAVGKTGAAKLAAGLLSKASVAKLTVVLAVGGVGAGTAYLQSSSPERAKVAAPATPVPRSASTAGRRDLRLVPPHDDTVCTEGAALASGCAVVGDAPAEGPAELTPVAPTAPSTRSRARRRAAAPAERRETAAKSAPIDSLRDESVLLAQARARLRARDLAGAEQALQQARERFPSGSLGQEREVLQLELLAALGDHEGADHRARRFLRKYPQSAHVKSVQRFLIDP